MTDNIYKKKFRVTCNDCITLCIITSQSIHVETTIRAPKESTTLQSELPSPYNQFWILYQVFSQLIRFRWMVAAKIEVDALVLSMIRCRAVCQPDRFENAARIDDQLDLIEGHHVNIFFVNL